MVPKLHFKITSHPNFISSAVLTKRGSFPGLSTGLIPIEVKICSPFIYLSPKPVQDGAVKDREEIVGEEGDHGADGDHSGV